RSSDAAHVASDRDRQAHARRHRGSEEGAAENDEEGGAAVITMLADHVWQSTLVAAALGLFTLTLRRNSARYRYWVWFCASLKFLVPFSGPVGAGGHLAVRGWPAAPTAPVPPFPSHAVAWAAPLVERVAHPLAGLSARAPVAAETTAAASTAAHGDLTTVA